MQEFLDKYHFLKSRKFWTFVFTWMALLITCLKADPFPVDNFVNASVALAIGYMGSVAFEDGLEKRKP
jgi:hypothetical protein